MSGIAGIIYPDIFQMNDLIEPMLDSIRHRGKSGEQSHTFKNIQIGICGGELGTNEKKTIVAALDGVLFNIEDLKKELKKRGYPNLAALRHTDLIIHAYELWGIACVEKLEGEFAFAILDHNKERIFLARDRIGKKPLYWYYDQNHFIFGSELKALLITGAIPLTPAKDAMALYLYFGYIPQDMTPIKKVNKLLPGHFLQLNRDRSMNIQSYWSYSSYFVRQGSIHKNEIMGTLESLLKKSVDLQAIGSQNAGCLISGGIGSACIAHYLYQSMKKESLSGYTVGFQGNDDSDIEAARQVACSLGIPHKCYIVTPETFLDDLVKIVWHLDEPLADPNAITIWKLAQAASKETEIVFSGMGSDELFGSHSRYVLEGKGIGPLMRMENKVSDIIRQALIPVLNFFHFTKAFEILKQTHTNPWQFEYLRQNAIFNENALKAAAPKLAKLFDPVVFLHKFHNLSRIQSTLSSFLYFDVKTRLPDCHIQQVERLTAAFGLNWRTPFLDKSLIEFLASLPDADAGVDKSLFFKKLLKDIFPEELIGRPKLRRSHFLQSWVHKSNLSEIFRLLLRGTLVETKMISEAWLKKQMETEENMQKSFKYLWSILMLEAWLKVYVDQPLLSTPPETSIHDLLAKQ